LIIIFFFFLVVKTGDNISSMQRMITQFHNSIHSAYPFYYYIGSGPLWQQNIEMLTQMKEKLKHVRINVIKTNDDNSKSHLDSLPIEIQCEVIRRLDNGKDIINVGMINSNLYRVTQELLLWRQLCHYHFSDQTQNSKHSVSGEKILGFIKRQQKDADMDNIDWKKVYFRLKRRYGLREVYAEMIHQCQLCKSLFWQVS
jgi:F-box protein 25/32